MAQTEVKTVVVDSAYKITVPAYMEEVKDLVDDPALQMKFLGNPPLLLTVRAEKRSQINALDSGFTAEEYYAYIAQRISAKLTGPETSPMRPDSISGYRFLQGQIHGTFQGTRLVYFVRTIETKDYCYQLIAWTEEAWLSESLIGNDIVQMLNSFTILREP